MGGFRSTTGRFLKYQVLAAVLVGLVILPLFRLALTGLIHWSGRSAISSGDYVSFLLSVQGIVLVLVGLLALSLLIVININGLMLIAADSLKGNHRATLWGDLRAALARSPGSCSRRGCSSSRTWGWWCRSRAWASGCPR